MIQTEYIADRERLEEAVKLITRVYAKSGYIDPGNPSDSISRYLFSSSTRTFTVRRKKELLGTLSVISDSYEGLPLDLIFKAEMDDFRNEGKRLAEVGQFAIDREFLKEIGTAEGPALDRVVSLELFKLAFHYGLRKDLDLYCIGVNPKHEAFYRWMGFEQFADTRAYSSVSGAPAVPLKIDLKAVLANHEKGGQENAVITELFANPPHENTLEAALAFRFPSFIMSLAAVLLGDRK